MNTKEFKKNILGLRNELKNITEDIFLQIVNFMRRSH